MTPTREAALVMMSWRHLNKENAEAIIKEATMIAHEVHSPRLGVNHMLVAMHRDMERRRKQTSRRRRRT